MSNVKSASIELPDLDQLVAMHKTATAAKDVDRVRSIDTAIERIAAAEAAALEARILTVRDVGALEA